MEEACVQEIGLAASAPGSPQLTGRGSGSGLLLWLRLPASGGLRLRLRLRLGRRLPMPWADGWLVVETHRHVELKGHALLKHTSRGSLRDAAVSGRAQQALQTLPLVVWWPTQAYLAGVDVPTAA